MVESGSNGITSSSPLSAEVKAARDLVGTGDYAALNSDQFPLLARSGRLTALRINAMRTVVQECTQSLFLFRNDPTSVARILLQAQMLQSQATETCAEFPDPPASEVAHPSPFGLSNDDMQSISLAINLGIPEIINPVHLPGLTGMPEYVVARWRILAANQALSQLTPFADVSLLSSPPPHLVVSEHLLQKQFYEDLIRSEKSHLAPPPDVNPAP